MNKFISKFAADESGATAIEYGLIAGLLGVGIASTVTALKTQVNTTFTDVKNSLAAAK